MANQLPEPWDGHHLMALLCCMAWGIQHDEKISIPEAKQGVIDWYCSSSVDVVVNAMENYKETNQFKGAVMIQEMMHSDPERVEEALTAIRNGWKPGDPK